MNELKQYIEDKYTAADVVERIGISTEELLDHLLYQGWDLELIVAFGEELTFKDDIPNEI